MNIARCLPFSFIAPVLRLSLLLVATCIHAQDTESNRQPSPDPAGDERAAQKLEAARARLKKTGDDTYTIGDIQFNGKTHEIRFPALLNMTDGVLEYAIVHENGKTHESLLRTHVQPTELNLAMLLTHYEPHVADAAKHLPEILPQTKALMAKPMEKPGANRIQIDLEYKDKEGKAQRVPISEWIHDRKSGKPMELEHWTYTGSLINEVGFAADFDGSIAAIYFDLVAMINCPVPDNSNDEIWQVETKDVPELDTPVTVIITPVSVSP